MIGLAELGAVLPAWDPAADDRLVCRRVIEETHDVKTFVLAAPEPRQFRFAPGQFLTLALEIDGQPVSRCYTIASAPTRPHRVAITVKRVPGGPVSNWLHDRLVPGMELRADGPLGDFSCANHPAAKYLFLSAGSGITPLASMARTWADLGDDADIIFVQAARSPADLIFHDELLGFARSRPGFRLATLCERDAPGAAWAGYRGRLSPAMLDLIAPDLGEREVFTCGPAPFMAAVRAMLDAAFHPRERHHEESFAFAAAPEAPEAVPAAAADGFRVQFTKSGRTIACDGDTPLLTAARAAGLRLPAACLKGVCGTCKSRMVEGRVEMRHGGGIRQREIDQGQILLCCARPRADLVIER